MQRLGSRLSNHSAALGALAAVLITSACGGQASPPTSSAGADAGAATAALAGISAAAEAGVVSDLRAIVSDLRAIVSAQLTYSSTCANFGYAQQFEDLHKPMRNSTSVFLSPDIVTGLVKRGYAYTLTTPPGAAVITPATSTCNDSSRDAVSAFFAEAHPVQPGPLGGRSFAVDERGTVYARADGEPIAPGMAGATELH